MKAQLMIVLLCFAFPFIGFVQELPGSTKQQLENLAEVSEEELEDDSYLQQLAYLQRQPLNLNTATADDLRVFHFLTDLQIQQLVHYRSLLGPLVSIYELQSIPAWDLTTIKKVLPFVTLNCADFNTIFRSRFKEGEHKLLLRISRVLEPVKGSDKVLPTHYTGTPYHGLLRYRYQYKNTLQYGLTSDKDAGEPFFGKKNSSGFDFYSFHFFTKNIGKIKALATGDYTVNLGQGLIQWQSLAFKKSTEVLAIKRQSPVLKPYTSAGEFYFNRGAGISLVNGKFETTVFASLRNVSANTKEDSLSDNGIFTSFLPSGLHRTTSERLDKNSIQQTSFGGNINYQGKRFSLGLNSVYYHFSKAYLRRDEPYNRFSWKGQQWYNFSVDYSYTYKNLHAFGEAALDKRGSKAVVNGALISLHSKLDLSIQHRLIAKEYQAVYGNAFTENFQPGNESGFYAGIIFRPNTVLQINAYADFYSFPWLKYLVDAPGSGKDYLVQISYSPNKQLELYSRFRSESKESNQKQTNSAFNYLLFKPKLSWRTQFSYSISPNTNLRGRTELMWYNKSVNKEEGYLLYVEGHHKVSTAFSGNVRLQYFETDSYNSRIYAFENDVLYSYSIPAFFDTGWRYYINVNYDLSKKASLWLRWSQTVYRDKTAIGTGLDEIRGNTKTDIKVQGLYTF